MKLGQLFVLGFYGKVIPNWIIEFAGQFGLGGVILFDYSCQTKSYENNIESKAQLSELCGNIAQLPSNPLVFIDQEGGFVRRLKDSKGFAPLSSQKSFGKLSTADKLTQLSRSYSEMRSIGINFNLAPVIDVDHNPRNPNIGAIERSYSSNLSEVVRNTLLVAKIAESNKIGLCLKHYPGIGGAHVDSHLDLLDISNQLNLAQEELFYKLAPRVFGNAILVSHSLVRQWDDINLISCSPSAINRVRSRIDSTLLISDDLQMQGVQKLMNTEEAVMQSLKAGIDMVCIGNNLINEEAAIYGIAHRVEQCLLDGYLTRDAVARSVCRVIERKALVGSSFQT